MLDYTYFGMIFLHAQVNEMHEETKSVHIQHNRKNSYMQQVHKLLSFLSDS